jgi:uracil phosphoribosyltransferase
MLKRLDSFKQHGGTDNMGKVYVFDHPLIQHKTAMIRDKNTSVKDFRELVREISMLMAYEVTRNLPLKDVEVETPLCKATLKMLQGEDLAIVPILRAGLGMVDGMLELIPNAKVGHVGLYRDPETHKPVEYYCKLPADIENRQVIVVDPMLATGGSAAAAIDFIKEKGAKKVAFMCLIAAPEGIEVLQGSHPDVDIYIAAKDSHLNDHAYIVPGLGDAGDRLYGTK